MTRRYTLNVKTQAKENEVIQKSAYELSVSVTAAKQQGKANQAVVAAVAKFLDKPKWKVQMTAGFLSPRKIIEVLD